MDSTETSDLSDLNVIGKTNDVVIKTKIEHPLGTKLNGNGHVKNKREKITLAEPIRVNEEIKKTCFKKRHRVRKNEIFFATLSKVVAISATKDQSIFEIITENSRYFIKFL